MAKNQNLYDDNGRMIGYLSDRGNTIELHNRNGSYQGYYDKRTGHTYKANGGVYAFRSNVLIALLRN
jgi:hypothetical protein